MKRCLPVLTLLLCLLGNAPAQTRRALIIGIDTYQPTGTTASTTPAASMGDASLAPSKTSRAP